jgi:lysophospholipase L1-like esterase
MHQDAIIRETSEWTNIWWDHADDPTIPRVLLIGDSISVGYTKTVIERLQGIAHVDRLANSKGINDPAHFKELGYMLSEYRYKAIHFNNGLHGWHIPDDVYAFGLRHMVQTLQHYGQGARLVWASSTPIAASGDPAALDPDKNPQVIRRNDLASDIMQSYGIPINDLYTLMLDRPELRSRDSYHFNADGQAVQGEAVASILTKLLG